ncbi:MAG: hypothetical protein PVF82_14060 [Gammaproteobacteria bacterium]|jgi:hypothetical protein
MKDLLSQRSFFASTAGSYGNITIFTEAGRAGDRAPPTIVGANVGTAIVGCTETRVLKIGFDVEPLIWWAMPTLSLGRAVE